MAKKAKTDEPAIPLSDQKKPTTPDSLREVARLLGRFATELEEVAKLMEKQGKSEIHIRGRASLDQLFVRLNGFLGNAWDACGVLSVLKELHRSYHVEEKPKQQK
jgi:hypothetical protein